MDKKIMKVTKRELQIFVKEMEKVIQEYCGFEVKMPINIEDNTLHLNIAMKFPINTPEFNERIEEVILEAIQNSLLDAFQEIEYVDIDTLYKSLHSIKRDSSLSLIFDDYTESNNRKKYRYIRMIEDFKEVSSSTYEGEDADISVIYCPNKKALNQVKNLELEFISLPSKKKFVEFFKEEKPLIKLIDGKSLAIVVNKNFEVIALLRKPLDGKSLSFIIENSFNNFSSDNVQKYVLRFLKNAFTRRKIELVNDIKAGQEESVEETVVEYISLFVEDALEEVFEQRPLFKSPEFIYLTSSKNVMSVFTSNPFIVAFENNDWKLKHYDLFNMYITSMTLTQLFIKLIVSDAIDSKEEIERLFENNNKLLRAIRFISDSKQSSIFLITLDKNFSNKRDKSTSSLEPLIFGRGDKYYMEVIRKEGKNINFYDMDSYLFQRVATIDGTVIMDGDFNIISIGEIINVPKEKEYSDTFGTGTRAARYASNYGIAIKVSEDGDIYLYDKERLLLHL